MIGNIPILRDIVLPIVDVLLLAFIIYKGYQILVQTRAVQLVKGSLFIALTYAIAFLLNLETLLWIMNILVPSAVIALAIIFQPELRKIFIRIGQGKIIKLHYNARQFDIGIIMNAVKKIAAGRRGALFVLTRTSGIRNVIETGTILDAEISVQLLTSIFSHDTMLHDCATIISNGRVAAAGCFLPLSYRSEIRRSFGTRHRAALGMVEESDAVVIVISEETGKVSLAHDGNIYYDLSSEELERNIINLMGSTSSAVPSPKASHEY